MRIGIIGLGKMGEMIIHGLGRSNQLGPLTLTATTRSQESATEASKRLKIPCSTDNVKLAESSDVILLCTKPQQAEAVLKSIGKKIKPNQTLISICASISISQISDWLKSPASIIRAMPNTPCSIGMGMTVLCSSPTTKESNMNIAKAIFDTLGKTTVIEESLMDGATGLSGCGPAYVYVMIEALSEAGVKVGLPRKAATLMAAQTLMGAAQMVLEKGIHPAALKDEVTTPAGCTIDGIMALEEGKFRVTLIKAVLAATRRSQKRRDELNKK